MYIIINNTHLPFRTVSHALPASPPRDDPHHWGHPLLVQPALFVEVHDVQPVTPGGQNNPPCIRISNFMLSTNATIISMYSRNGSKGLLQYVK